MIDAIAVAFGGALGAVCRYLVGLAVGSLSLDLAGFPLATFIANVLGCFAIGILSVFFEQHQLPSTARLFAITGVLGGFTTFSTFSLETMKLFEAGDTTMGCINAGVSLVSCLAGVWLGRMVGSLLFTSVR